jgi:hypothetical protein
MFNRLANLWKGFLSLWISGIEKEHPEIAYENAINMGRRLWYYQFFFFDTSGMPTPIAMFYLI